MRNLFSPYNPAKQTMINYLTRRNTVSSKEIKLHALKNDLEKFCWKVADIGLDKNSDGLIEQSLMEHSYRNLILEFKKNKTGSIIQTNKAGKKLFYLFDWQIDGKESLLIISSEHSLFELKPKWKIRINSKGLLLFYEIKLPYENVKVVMSLEKQRKLKKHSPTVYLANYFLSLFSFLTI